MSTSKGNLARKRPQKHQNRTSFKNDLHDTSRKTKLLNSLEINGVCKRCKDIIDWKIKYKKYKPLTAPGKCVGCSEKSIKHAYHVLCNKCATENCVCAKCCKPADNDNELLQSNSELKQNLEIQTMLKTLPERKRRTVLRYLNKQEESKSTIEVKSLIEGIMSGVGNIDLNYFDFSDDELGDNSDEE